MMFRGICIGGLLDKETRESENMVWAADNGHRYRWYFLSELSAPPIGIWVFERVKYEEAVKELVWAYEYAPGDHHTIMNS